MTQTKLQPTQRIKKKSALQTDHTVSEHNHRRQSVSDTNHDSQCQAVVEESDDQPDLCTIYSTAPGDSITTTWITAEEGSYYSPEEIR